MQIVTRSNAFQTAPLPQAPAPGDEPAPVPNERSFANLLQRSQPARPAPLPAPAQAAAPQPAKAEAATDAPEDSPPAQRPRLAPRPPARAAGKPATGPAVVDEAQAARTRATAEDPVTADSAAPLVPDTPPWQVPMLPPPPATPPALPVGSEDGGAAWPAAGAGAARGRIALPAADDAAGAASASASSTDAITDRTQPALEPTPGDSSVGAGATELPHVGPATPNSFAALLASASPQGSTREPAAVATASLPTPTTSPEFAQTLGVQVSVFAREGVQHAELHLNPAETGPVSVQIVLDGNQARVDFGADLAATREAIEAGLPELAAALREAGFTLSGGGVSQHAGGRGDSGESRGGDVSPQRGRPEPAAETTPRPTRSRVSAGGVDLYA